jgi:serine/threonine protein kinase
MSFDMSLKIILASILLLLSMKSFALDIVIDGVNYQVSKKPFSQGTFGTIYTVQNSNSKTPKFIIKEFKTNKEIPVSKQGKGMNPEEEILFHNSLRNRGIPTVSAIGIAGRRVLLKPFVNGFTLTVLLKTTPCMSIEYELLKKFLHNLVISGIVVGDLHTDNIMFDIDSNQWLVIDGEMPIASEFTEIELLNYYQDYMIERLGPSIDPSPLRLVFEQIADDFSSVSVSVSVSVSASASASASASVSASASASEPASASSSSSILSVTKKSKKPIMQGLSRGLVFSTAFAF